LHDQHLLRDIIKEKMTKIFENKTIVVTGGTGSLGKVLIRRLLLGENGCPKKIIVFSRDEAKQHDMRMSYETHKAATEEIIYYNYLHRLQFRIGDIRDYHSVCSVLREADIVINAAALKQVPSCEYFPFEAVQTNIVGAQNIITAIRENDLPVQTVVGVSTDKAVKPLNVMGMTKAIQERIFITANIASPKTRFVGVRYGNVLASRGSVVPLFREQIRSGGPVTITTKEMTRFLLPLDKGVDTIFRVINCGKAGEIYIPRVPAAKMIDVAEIMVGDRNIEIKETGIRPGEKIHECLVSKEEAVRTYIRGDYYAISSMLPEIASPTEDDLLNQEYSSNDFLMSKEETKKLLKDNNLLEK
jgi:FlaA1/EpsC-like NDP-sugar epimerase